MSVFRFGRRPRTGGGEVAALERALARTLAPATLPPDRAAQIRARLLDAPVRRPRGRAWQLPCAAVLALGAAGALWHRAQPRLETAAEAEAPSGFEQVALDLHLGAAHVATATLATASAAEARAWGRARTGVDVNLPAVRPAEDQGRFELRAVAAVEHRGAPALAVWYEVDEQPVTLAVARAEDVPDGAPAWTLAGKSVRSRAAGGHRLLSWTNSGQSYVLVADLPGDGRRACFVCHTQPARRRVIDRLAP